MPPRRLALIMVRCHDTCHLKWFNVGCWQKWTLVKDGWVEVHLPTLLSSTFWVCKLWLQDNQEHYVYELLLNCMLQNILGQLKRARMWENAGSKGTSNFCFTWRHWGWGWFAVSYGSGDTHGFSSPRPQVLNQAKEEAEKRVLVCVCVQGREWCMCVCTHVCVCMCVLGREMEDRGFSCVCVYMCVLVRQRVVCVRVCVCVGEGHEGWREGFPETEPQRNCLGKKEILWFDFIFQSSQLRVKKHEVIVTKILNL